MKLSIDECVYGPVNDNEEVLGNLTELELSWFIGRFRGPQWIQDWALMAPPPWGC